MRKVSITDRMIVYYVLLGCTALAVIGTFTYNISSDSLMDRTFDQLTSIKTVKQKQIENFFSDRVKDCRILSHSPEIISLSGSKETVFNSEITEYLEKYININSYYNRIIILFDNKSYNIITKSTNNSDHDFLDDEYLHQIAGLINIESSGNRIFEIFDDEHSPGLYISGKIGGTGAYLLMDISYESINAIMQEFTPESGLGNSGESYIVADDFLMRSESRFLKNSSHKITVKTEGVLKSLDNKSGTSIFDDYRGKEVLSSYGKLNIPGLNWVILAEIDFDEASKPVVSLRNNILFSTVLISILVFIVTYFISKKITNPVIKLTRLSEKISKGDYSVTVSIDSKDEIGTLSESFNNMVENLKKNEEELERERLKRSSLVIDAQDSERERLSRELHDGIGQNFVALKLQLESIDNGNGDLSMEILEKVKRNLDRTVDDIRLLSNNLMPSVLKEFGLSLAVRNLSKELSSLGKTEFDCSININLDNIGKKNIIYLYRIIQESLINVLKHSDANRAVVDINENNNMLQLKISDDGKGFDFDKAIKGSGNGLYNIRERARLINAKISFISKPGKGTVLELNMPLSGKSNE